MNGLHTYELSHFESPLSKEFGWKWHCGFEENEMWKVYYNDDNGQNLIRKASLSFRIRWAKNGGKFKYKGRGI